MSMNNKCFICNKPTRSHHLGNQVFVCHSCYSDEELEPVIEKLKTRIKKNKIETLLTRMKRFQARNDFKNHVESEMEEEFEEMNFEE